MQWFPGHMSKTLRELKEIKTDIYFLLLDSRAPESTFIDSFNEIVNPQKTIIFLTKIDLVQKNDAQKFIMKYKKNFLDVKMISLKNSKIAKKEMISLLSKIKFKSLLPKIIILGSPNVGKSTMLNILGEKKKANVENRPGVTKNNYWYQFEKKYWILDTPGVLQPKFISEKQGVNLSSIGSIKLDILPLEKVALGLVDRLKELNVLDINDSEKYIENFPNFEKHPNEVYKKIIKDFQNLKYGKIILD